MLGWWRDRRERERRAKALYGWAADTARDVRLYADLGIADSVDGRLDMLVLHLVLLRDRLDASGAEGRLLGEGVTEQFVTAMDDTMRQLGVGDLAVPRKVKKSAAALYDAHREYGAACRIDADAAHAAWRHVFQLRLVARGAAPGADVDGLIAHVEAVRARLKALPDDTVLTGRLG